MCNDGHDHSHNEPEIIQIMSPVKDMYAVYKGEEGLPVHSLNSERGLNLVPIVFLGLIKEGHSTSVEGFFASTAIGSCEEIEGFAGYASSFEEADKLYL